MYEYKKNLRNKEIPRGMIPIGNVIRFFMGEPEYIRKRFLKKLILLDCGDLSFTEKQDLAHEMIDEYFFMMSPKPGMVV